LPAKATQEKTPESIPEQYLSIDETETDNSMTESDSEEPESNVNLYIQQESKRIRKMKSIT
jgi:hypothetical protein